MIAMHSIFEIPFRFAAKSLAPEEEALICPVCGSDSVQPDEVAVEQGRTRTVVTGEGTCVVPRDRPERAAGSLIALSGVCRNGHVFQYEFEFRGGRIRLHLVVGHRDASQPSVEPWRD